MKKDEFDTLDEIAASVKREGDDLSAAEVSEATDRVWSRLTHLAEEDQGVLDCQDLQSLMPAYLQGSLKMERTFLLEDHVKECFACRRALKKAREGDVAVAEVSTGNDSRWWRYAAAALAVLGLGTGAWLVQTQLDLSTAPAIVNVAQGEVLHLTDEGYQSLVQGSEIAYGEEIRTSKDSGAIVTLSDGSRVEMDRRSTVSVKRTSRGTTINLKRGHVVVEAADQHDGKLYLATDDFLVSVVGTVFTVNSGARGSRVAVYEGEVHVARRGEEEEVLLPGDQTQTEGLNKVSLAHEISWSQNADQHLAILEDLVDLEEALMDIQRPGLRYASTLLPLAPQGSLMFLGFPNMSETLMERLAVIEAKALESEAFAEWRQEWDGSGELWEEIFSFAGDLTELGTFLGDEIAVIVAASEDGVEAPLFVAEVANLEALYDALSALSQENEELVLLEEGTDTSGEALWVYVDENYVVAGPEIEVLDRMLATLGGQAPSWAGESLPTHLAERYTNGVETLLGVGLGQIIAREADEEDSPTLDRLGITDIDELILEHRVVNERNDLRASLSFDGPRRGLAAWLAAPAPIGALDFVSPEASLVGAFAVQDPAVLFDEWFAIMMAEDPDFRSEFEAIQSEHGIDIRADLAAPLGGELVFAVDGPLVPTPAWKVVAEVYDAGALQHGLETLVSVINTEAAEHGGEADYALMPITIGSQEAWAVTKAGQEYSVYTYASGYFVATANRGLLERALRYQDTGYNLPTSDRFREALPTDSEVNFSAVFYQDVHEIVGLMASAIGSSLTPEQRQALDDMTADQGPGIAVAYAESDVIRLAGSTGYSPLGMFGTFSHMAGMGAIFDTIGALEIE